MTDPQPSGVDLARAALAAARAAAKTRPTQPQRQKTQGRRQARTGGRDPQGLGAAIAGMIAERGWEPPEAGGSIIDQWPTIAPELAEKVHAVRFEHDNGTLHLRPVSDAYATQLRMFGTQILRRIHDKTGNTAVRRMRILPPGSAPGTDQADLGQETSAAAPDVPVRTRETASPGYRRNRELLLAHRPQHDFTDPRLLTALERQNAVLKSPANREPEDAFTDAVAELEQLTMQTPDRGEAIRRAAIARKQAGGDAPVRRAFDVA